MPKVQTTQATGKFWKLLMLLGGGAALVGGGWLVVRWIDVASDQRPNAPDLESSSPATALVLLFVGLLVYFVGRAGAWWFHG